MAGNELSYEQQSYEVEALWTKLSASERDLQRVKYIASLIPEGVRSIVDVGCGNGIFLNFLQANGSRFDRLCGIDRSVAALKHVTTEKRQGDIADLPFRDREFDLVVCLEVLEHLPLPIYAKALAELCRVASGHIVVCVPYHEDLALSHVTCPECCTRFSADYHVRSFTRQAVESLFAPHGFVNRTVFQIGEVDDHYRGLKWYSRFRALESRFSWYAICPACGYREDLTPRPEPGAAKRSLKEYVKRLWPKKRKARWIGGLFDRQPHDHRIQAKETPESPT